MFYRISCEHAQAKNDFLIDASFFMSAGTVNYELEVFLAKQIGEILEGHTVIQLCLANWTQFAASKPTNLNSLPIQRIYWYFTNHCIQNGELDPLKVETKNLEDSVIILLFLPTDNHQSNLVIGCRL